MKAFSGSAFAKLPGQIRGLRIFLPKPKNFPKADTENLEFRGGLRPKGDAQANVPNDYLILIPDI
jgi:hypothetical protein